MLGRGLLAQPDLALAINAWIRQEAYQPLAWPEVLKRVWQYHQSTVPNYESRYLGNRLKQWLMYLQRHYPQALMFFETVKKLRDAEALEEAYQQHMAIL